MQESIMTYRHVTGFVDPTATQQVSFSASRYETPLDTDKPYAHVMTRAESPIQRD